MYELDATIKKSGKMWVKKSFNNLEPIKNSLSNYVRGPEELSLILSQIGIVNNAEEALKSQKELKIGQSLVDKRGNLWRVGRFYFRRKFAKQKNN